MGREESKGLASRDSKSLRKLGSKKSQKKGCPVQVIDASLVSQVLHHSTHLRACRKVQWVVNAACKARAIVARGFTLILLVFNAIHDQHLGMFFENSLIIKRVGCRNGHGLQNFQSSWAPH